MRLMASRTLSLIAKPMPVCARILRRFNSSPSSRKNNSSKIRRMCAGVRAACRFVRLSPTSGQCACQNATRRSMSCMRPRTDGGNRVGNVGLKILQHAVDDAAKPARGQAAVAGGLVDGDDAADFERLPLLVFVVAACRLRRRVVQDFELRLKDLEAMPVAIAGFDFAVERDQHAGTKLVLQIRSR